MENKKKRAVNSPYGSTNRGLESLGEKLDRLIELNEMLLRRLGEKEQKPSFEGLPLDVDTLLTLQDHLRKTAMTLITLGDATADQVAAQTGRSRAAESDYLNQLTSLGHIKKERRGQSVYFTIKAK